MSSKFDISLKLRYYFLHLARFYLIIEEKSSGEEAATMALHITFAIHQNNLNYLDKS